MLQLLLLLTFVGLAVGLAWFLISRDRGTKEPIDALWLAVGFGIAGAMIAAYTETKVINSDNLLTGMPTSTILNSAMMVGFIEEICKFVPLSIFIYKKKYFNEYTDGIIYFGLAGLGFGLPENILYTLQYGLKTGMLRLFLTPIFHAATTAGVGYFLIRAKINHKSPVWVVLPLIAMAVVHGIYDFGLVSGSSTYGVVSFGITISLTIGFFVMYLRATSLDQALGLSTVGHNDFCRACGKPNPKHNLYCTRCGKNA